MNHGETPTSPAERELRLRQALLIILNQLVSQVRDAVEATDQDKLREIRDNLTVWFPAAIRLPIWEQSFAALGDPVEGRLFRETLDRYVQEIKPGRIPDESKVLFGDLNFGDSLDDRRQTSKL